MSANPEFYPYTDDPTKGFQICDNTLYQLNTMYGNDIDPSCFMCESAKMRTTFLGFSWTIEEEHITIANPTVIKRFPTGGIGLADQTSNFGTPIYGINTTANYSPVYPDNVNQNIWGGARSAYNLNRWATGKESVSSGYYRYKPCVKLHKGCAVGYMTIIALKEIPLEFETVAAANTFFGNRFSGSLAAWEAVKTTYPNIIQVSIAFKVGNTPGSNSRTKTMYPFFKARAAMTDGQSGGAYDGGFSYYIPSGYPREGEYIGGDMVPAGSEHIAYPAIDLLFRGGWTVFNIAEWSMYGTCPYLSKWYILQGMGDPQITNTYVWNGSYKNPVTVVTLQDDPRELLNQFLHMGFAMTDQTSNKAQTGDIPTDPTIWVPTYDSNGDVDGFSNDSDDGQDYVDGGTAGQDINPNYDPSGGGGDDDDEDIPEEDPSEEQQTDEVTLPDVSLTSYGVFNRSYVMSKQTLQFLSDYLWNNDPDIWSSILEDLALVGDNRMNSIINCIMFPFVIPNDDGVHRIRIGRHTTDVSAAYLDSSQNITFDMGSCYCYPQYKCFLDYEPYTKGWLYIPFIGVFPIPLQQFMNKYIHITLAVDVLTGSGEAVVFAGGIPVIYKNCKIGMQIPITGSDSGYIIKNYLEAVQGGFTAITGLASGNVSGTVSGLFKMGTSALAAHGAPIQSEGSASPQCGMLMPNKCYFIIERPKTKIEDMPDYGHLIGYACRKSGQVGSFNGFSRFENVSLNISHCTETERNEILTLLRSGVFV